MSAKIESLKTAVSGLYKTGFTCIRRNPQLSILATAAKIWKRTYRNYLCCTKFHHTKKQVMNKGELIDKIAKDTKLTKRQSSDALDAVLSAVTTTLGKGGKVTLVGFGTFSVSKRASRKGRNPRTNKEITIKAKKVAKFKAGVELAKKVNKG